jgi:hypothetical protein
VKESALNEKAEATYQYVVVGAGLSALSCVLALLDRGIKPLVIDRGASESEDTARKVHYDEKIFRQLKDYETKGHIYASPFAKTEISLPNSPIAISSGLGGLSNVWGGGWQPINAEQFDWFSPIIAQQMQESSEKLLNYFNYSGHIDALNNRFPLPITNSIQHICEIEYDYFTRKKQSHPSIDGVLFGFPRRLHCGSLCRNLHSQSNPLNASHYFESLQESNSIFFEELKVLEIQKSSPLTVIGYDSNEIRHEIHCEKILLAAGTVASSAIILRSLQEIDKVEIRDSQMFYTAFLSIKKSPFGNRKKSEAFGNLISSGDKSRQSVEFSCSMIGPSRDFVLRIENLLPCGLGKLLAWNSIVNRLYMSIGFIDQVSSGKLLIEKSGAQLKIRLMDNLASRKEIKKVRRLLRKWGLKHHLIMLPLLFTPRAKVGSGFHSGAISHVHQSIASDDGEGDICEMKALKGVHLVDTSSIPKIPAGAHSYIAMVNAYRVSSRI